MMLQQQQPDKSVPNEPQKLSRVKQVIYKGETTKGRPMPTHDSSKPIC